MYCVVSTAAAPMKGDPRQLLSLSRIFVRTYVGAARGRAAADRIPLRAGVGPPQAQRLLFFSFSKRRTAREFKVGAYLLKVMSNGLFLALSGAVVPMKDSCL